MSLPNPITRTDHYLNKIADPNYDGEMPNPITRKDHYLNALAENAGSGGLPAVTGDDNGDILAVSSGTWRKSDKLKAVVNAGIDDTGKIPIVGVGGNWGLTDFPANELPAVTGDDDGKVLGVTNGAWDAVTPSSKGLVIFNINSSNILLDNKTFADVKAAILDGNDVALKQGEYLFRLIYSPTNTYPGAHFIKFQFLDNNVVVTALYGNLDTAGAKEFNRTALFRCVPSAQVSSTRKLLTARGATFEYIDPELPTVSASDNGKILKVVDGAWAAVTP